MLLLALNKNRPWRYARAFLCLKLFCFIKVKNVSVRILHYIGKEKAFFSFMKAPHRGTICLFLAKTVKNSKISHFKQVFCKKSAKSGLKFAKTAKSTTFYQLWDMQTSPRFFYPYESRKRHKQQPLND